MNISIYCKDNKYYFMFKNKELNLSSESLSFIKENINYPASFIFNNVPLVIIKEIINYFDEWNINIKLDKVEDNKYVVGLDKCNDKVFLPAYRIFGDFSFERVNKEVNPYHYIPWDLKLEEVSREGLNPGLSDYLYFLGSDLNDKEKENLKYCYQEVVVSDVVRLRKNKKRTLKKN